MLNDVLIAIGSAVGHSFPWGTLVANVSGWFIIGFFASITAPEGRWFVGSYARSFFMIGVCGGYTTFSSFRLRTLNLARDEEWLYASGNAVLSLVLCLVSVWLGQALAAVLNPSEGA